VNVGLARKSGEEKKKARSCRRSAIIFWFLARRADDEEAKQRRRRISILLLARAAHHDHEAARYLRSALPARPLAADVRGIPALQWEFSESQLAKKLRFALHDVRRLATLLLPGTIILPGHHGRVSSVDALALLLLRLHSPASLESYERVSGFADYDISLIIRATATLLTDRWFSSIATPRWLTQNRCHRYATAIRNIRNDGEATLVGFVDGTRRPVAEPSNPEEQRQVYNGWIHTSNLLFIAIVFPDGSFVLRGPVCGRNNDPFLYDESGLKDELPDWLQGYKVGADGIFPNDAAIESTKIYLDGLCPADDGEGQRRFAAVRIVVEWLFALVSNLFRLFRYKEAQVINLTIPATFYKSAAILASCHTCLYGSEISRYFGLSPLRLADVFHH